MDLKWSYCVGEGLSTEYICTAIKASLYKFCIDVYDYKNTQLLNLEVVPWSKVIKEAVVSFGSRCWNEEITAVIIQPVLNKSGKIMDLPWTEKLHLWNVYTSWTRDLSENMRIFSFLWGFFCTFLVLNLLLRQL